MDQFFKNDFQWGIVKFGAANIQDLSNHFLIIFSIGLILYFAIFVDERSQPIINNAHHREEPSISISQTIPTGENNATVQQTTPAGTATIELPSSPSFHSSPENFERPPIKEEILPKTPKTPKRIGKLQPTVPTTAERKSLRTRKTPEKYQP